MPGQSALASSSTLSLVGTKAATYCDYYSGDSATGLFAAHPVSEATQAELLQAVDMFFPPEATAAAEGANETEACRLQS